MRKAILLILPFLLLGPYFVVRYFRIHFADTLPLFFKFYFTDLIFIPVSLGFAYLVVLLIKRPKKISVPVGVIAAYVIFNAFIFEYYLPNFAKNAQSYTSDWMDVLMYVIGGGLFWLWQRELSKS